MTTDKYAEQMSHEERLRSDQQYQDRWINEQALELMREGNECYPFTIGNWQQAITQAGDKELVDLVAPIRCYLKPNPVFDSEGQRYAKELYAEELMQASIKIAKDYWFMVARHIVIERHKL